MSQRPEPPCWVFDALPPSGQRRGGDPSEYAFNRTMDTFVREALQNANDQSLQLSSARAEVCFDLEELKGSNLESFFAALEWNVLHRHLRGAGDVKAISKFRSFAEKTEKRDRLVLLRVEDRHTSGLVGDEDTGESNFRALCRDSLLSHKQSEGAGGSYGLGKSVYWAFSELSTVIFHSCLHEAGAGRHRVIGRVELPSHVAENRAFMGPGWFGQRERVDGGERAVSLWGAQALDLAQRLHMRRPPKISGTTILVVGFRDPTNEEQEEIPAILKRIRDSAARFFWPAMNFPRPLHILVDGKPVPESDEAAAFVAAWQQRMQAGARLEKPGDVARRQLPLRVPRRRKDKENPELAHCELIVRLAEPTAQTSDGQLDNTLAAFRGPGMIVKYFPIDPAGTLPRFHAILACGKGRDPEAIMPGDRQAEAFLRTCEPPGHDAWESTPRLRDDYVKGGGVSVAQLLEEARKAIRELLLAPTSDAQRGPELLQRRYPLGSVGDPAFKSNASPFNFSGLDAHYIDGRWQFSGTVEPATSGHAWTATITLKMLGDDNSEVDRLKIAEFTILDTKRGKFEHTADGAVRVSATRTIDGLAFSGVSELLPDRDRLCELGLEISGELLSKGGV
jgi:hypothetical protein